MKKLYDLVVGSLIFYKNLSKFKITFLVFLLFFSVHNNIAFSQQFTCNDEKFDEVLHWPTSLKDKKVLIAGTMFINQSVTFDNCEIVFLPGASIVLEPKFILQGTQGPIYSFTFTIKNNTILRGCNGMWKGIEINIGRNGLNNPIHMFSNGYFNIENSTIEDAEIGIRCKYNIAEKLPAALPDIYASIHNVTFNNNYYGIYGNFQNTSIENCTFDYTALKPAYTDQEFYGPKTYAGIHNINGKVNIKAKSLFKNLENGIIIDDIEEEIQLVEKCEFENIDDRGIFVPRFESVNLSRNIFTNNNVAIQLGQLKSVEPLIDVRATANFNEIYDCNVGIAYKNFNANRISHLNNKFYNKGVAVSFSNIIFKDNIIRLSEINNCGTGLEFSNTKSNSMNSANIINTTIDNTYNGIILNASSNNNISKSIIRNTTIFPRTIGILTKNRTQNNFFKENSVDMRDGNNFLFQQGSNNSLCCNPLFGAGELMKVSGTNSNTLIRGTKMTGNIEMILQSSSIGTQTHAGNRWIGSNTEARLIDANFVLNRFIVNNSETNLTDGKIRPDFTQPSSINAQWFSNDPLGSGSTCQANCGLTVPPTTPVPLVPDENEDIPLPPGPCFPLDIDMDGDGVCDTSDPDPTNACIPHNLDKDGDGLCDPVDPDPEDPCIPLNFDTDGDGICDTSDPDPYDPCIPLSIDSDLDGICDRLDPVPNDGTVPGSWTAIGINDYMSDFSNEILPVSSPPNVHELTSTTEALSFTYGPSLKEGINDWENKQTIMEKLYQNPYYRKGNSNLGSFYQSQKIL